MITWKLRGCGSWAPALFAPLCVSLATAASFAQSWPELTEPAAGVGGGAQDAAIIISIENYAFVAPIPGAKANADAWYDYFAKTRGIPPTNIFRRIDSDGTAEDIKRVAVQAVDLAEKDGTLWFVFIGHGAPSADGKDGLLVGVDAQQKIESLNERSLAQGALLSALVKSRAGTIVVVMDACFSGRGVEGMPLVQGVQPLIATQPQVPPDERLILLTAAKGNEFAGQLPGEARPAFSYLVLGGLRGWADTDPEANITPAKLHSYADGVLRTMVKNRRQTPLLLGDGQKPITRSAGEKGPDLAGLAKSLADSTPIQFKTSFLPDVPRVRAPALSSRAAPVANAPAEISAKGTGIDFGSVDVDALEKYDAVVRLEKSDVAPEDKAAQWRELGTSVPTYSALARKRAAEWTRYGGELAVAGAMEFDKGDARPEEKAAKWRAVAEAVASSKSSALKRAKDWTSYAAELADIEKVREKRADIRDADYAKLKRLLALSVASDADKRRWAGMFVKAYGVSHEDNPHVGDLLPYLPEVSRVVPQKTHRDSLAPAGGVVERVEGTTIRGGAFNLDLNYPGVGARYFLTDKTAMEARAQYDGNNLAGGGRLYHYPAILGADSRFNPYLGVDGYYVSFKGASSKGSGYSAGAFAGIEYSLSRSFAMQLDVGGSYLSLKDRASSLTQSGIEFVFNLGINFYLKNRDSQVPQREEESPARTRVRERGANTLNEDAVRRRAENEQKEIEGH